MGWRTSTFLTTITGEWQYAGRPTDMEEPSMWDRRESSLNVVVFVVRQRQKDGFMWIFNCVI